MRSTLQIVPLDACLLHEETDPARVSRMVQRFASDKILHNPPIIGTHPELEELFVLDGATRVTALRQMGIPYIVAQIVEYTDPSIRLQRWQHVLPEISADQLVEALRGELQLAVRSCSYIEAEEALAQHAALLCIGDLTGRYLLLGQAIPLLEQVRALQRLGRIITRLGSPIRAADNQSVLPNGNSSQGVQIRYPAYRKEDVVAFVRAGVLLPAGITRHAVPERILRINISLEPLRSPGSLSEKQSWLAGWLDEQWSNHRIRYYQEPTIVFND